MEQHLDDTGNWYVYTDVIARVPGKGIVEGCTWYSRSATLALPDGTRTTDVFWSGTTAVVR